MKEPSKKEDNAEKMTKNKLNPNTAKKLGLNSNKKKSCRCFFKAVLAEDYVEFIKSLFRSVGRKCPEGKMLGSIDEGKSPVSIDCSFKHSWGYETYCDNQQYIKQYIKLQKTNIKN